MDNLKRKETMIPQFNGRENERFLELAHRLATLAAADGIKIVASRGQDLPYFSNLPSEAKPRVIGLLDTSVNVCERVQNHGVSLRSPKSLTWAFIKQINCTLSASLLENVKETDFIDCYDLNHEMMFANLRFFELMSYSLEDFYCRPWMDLFVRDRDEVHAQLFKMSEAMVQGKQTDIVSTDFIGTYRCYETDSQGMHRFLVGPRFFAPLRKDGGRAGYLCVNSIVRI